MTTIAPRWRKATRSGPQSNCVEIIGTLDRIRDSKNPGGPQMAGDVRALVAAIRAGQLG
jgi:hypothetical protein